MPRRVSISIHDILDSYLYDRALSSPPPPDTSSINDSAEIESDDIDFDLSYDPEDDDPPDDPDWPDDPDDIDPFEDPEQPA